VVTAQQREASLQDVPIAISAFTEAEIQKNMFRDVTDFVARTPNASFISNGARSRREISMRGVTNFVGANQARRTSTFGFYVDGFNLASSSINPPIMDIERIEVLRGPQSTYFGANALGGGISVITNAPHTERGRFGDGRLRSLRHPGCGGHRQRAHHQGQAGGADQRQGFQLRRQYRKHQPPGWRQRR
jgi:outer membrane receptor for ferrienterochelin and colicin